MSKVIRNSLTITALAALALVFGACSQPLDVAAETNQPVSEAVVDSNEDTLASAADLADIGITDSANPTDSTLQAQGKDKTPPRIKFVFPTVGYDAGDPSSELQLDFSETMNHDSVCKKALKVLVVPASGPAYNAKGKCTWTDIGDRDIVYWKPNKLFPLYSTVYWKVSTDAKDKAGNKLSPSKNGWFYIAYP